MNVLKRVLLFLMEGINEIAELADALGDTAVIVSVICCVALWIIGVPFLAFHIGGAIVGAIAFGGCFATYLQASYWYSDPARA